MTAPTRMALLVCTRDRARSLRRLLSALIRVDRARVSRIVVVDNASRDDTPRVIEEHAAHTRTTPASPPIEYRLEPEPGVAHARRHALRATDEPFVAFIDDDVVPAPDWPERALAAFAEAPNAGAVGGRIRLRWARTPSALARACRHHLAHQDFGDSPSNLTAPRAVFVAAALGLRREAIEASGWLDRGLLVGRTIERQEGGEDAEICIRLRRAGWDLRYEPTAVCEHFIPPPRLRRSHLARLVRHLAASDPWLRWIAEGEPLCPEWLERDCRRVRQRLRRSRLFEWRPNRRLLRVNDRAGRLDGLRRLRDHIASKDTA